MKVLSGCCELLASGSQGCLACPVVRRLVYLQRLHICCPAQTLFSVPAVPCTAKLPPVMCHDCTQGWGAVDPVVWVGILMQ